MGDKTQGELLPPEPEQERDEGAGGEILEQPDPVVEGMLAKLDEIEKEARSSLHRLQEGSTGYKLSECECDQCTATRPVIEAMKEKAKRCDCRLCRVTDSEGDQGHSGSCACKLCRAARMSIRAAQQMRGIIENEW